VPTGTDRCRPVPVPVPLTDRKKRCSFKARYFIVH